MARGASEEKNAMNKTARDYQTAAAPLYNQETGVISNQLANPGFDPVTAAAIRRAGMDTVNTATDAAKFSAAQRAGATGNDAMYYASADKLAQDRAKGLSDAATTAEVDIGKQKLASQQQAIQDASQLYNYNTNAATDLYGVGQRAQATQQPPVSLGWSAKNGLQVGVN
jgi:hypothetical protein